MLAMQGSSEMAKEFVLPSLVPIVLHSSSSVVPTCVCVANTRASSAAPYSMRWLWGLRPGQEATVQAGRLTLGRMQVIFTTASAPRHPANSSYTPSSVRPAPTCGFCVTVSLWVSGVLHDGLPVPQLLTAESQLAR